MASPAQVTDSGARAEMTRAPFLSPSQTIFLASMIALDFAYGLVVRTLLQPTHLLQVLRIDLVVPIALILLTRKLIDRFGVLTLYEGVWALLLVFASPGAFGLPGAVKLVPAIGHGLVMDGLMSVLRPWHRTRFLVTGIVGNWVGLAMALLLRVALGLPWATLVQMLFGIQLVTGTAMAAAGALLALATWEKIRDTPVVRRIQHCHG